MKVKYAMGEINLYVDTDICSDSAMEREEDFLYYYYWLCV